MGIKITLIYWNKLKKQIEFVHEKVPCDICTKAFMNKNKLQRHVSQIHKGNKPLPLNCAQCQKSVTNKSHLQRHIKAVHEGKRPHACHLCGLTFGQSGNLKTH